VLNHLKSLSKVGIGYKSVADAAGIARSGLARIISGERRSIRKDNELRVLSVDESAVADGAIVSAKASWKLLNELLKDGYTRKNLAKWLGSSAKVPSLQVGRVWVTARVEIKVKRMYALIKAGKLRRD
jgi:plasmid maintenance system antidote protein VapI